MRSFPLINATAELQALYNWIKGGDRLARTDSSSLSRKNAKVHFARERNSRDDLVHHHQDAIAIWAGMPGQSRPAMKFSTNEDRVQRVVKGQIGRVVTAGICQRCACLENRPQGNSERQLTLGQTSAPSSSNATP